MKVLIKTRIMELEDYVAKQRKVVIGYNYLIYEGSLPTESQRETVKYACGQGKWALDEIASLRKIMESKY